MKRKQQLQDIKNISIHPHISIYSRNVTGWHDIIVLGKITPLYSSKLNSQPVIHILPPIFKPTQIPPQTVPTL